MNLKEKMRLFLKEFGKLSFSLFLIFISSIAFYFVITQSVPQKLQVSFLDIGQGDSILIQTPSGHTMIIDGGPSNLVMQQLSHKLSYIDNDIDVMIATHPDSDHVTGLIPVLEKYAVHTIVQSGEQSSTGVFTELNQHINKENADDHIANAGDVIDFQDGVKATILHPYKGEHFKDTNSASVSIVLTYGNDSFLLTGDLPTTNEPLLLSSGLLSKNITVYKAGHHGSKYSSGDQLLSYIHPDYAVISAGKDNKYGHPNPEALERLEKYSGAILSTIDKGTISFSTDGNTMEVATDK